MSKIQKDSFGLFVKAGGYVCRPVEQTQFQIGDTVKTAHKGGSIIAGVGKDSNCKHGEYLEYWTTTGVSNVMESTQENINWYIQEFKKKYRHLLKGK
jgi:hypothetical protein